MAIRISDAFKISSATLVENGVFDRFLDIDSHLHVDPYLLRGASTKELENSYQHFQKYFSNVILLLDKSTSGTDIFFRQATRSLVFHEIPYAGLGYSRSNTQGKGIGFASAQQLAETAKEIIKVGIKDPVVFELVGLIEEGIGADRISDMTIRIILGDLLNYSSRIARELELKTLKIIYDEKEYFIPAYEGNAIILFPQEILRSLPVAFDWSDIDTVCSYNNQLRQKVNRIIGNTWRQATRRLTKGELRDALLRNPEALRDLINQYKGKKAKAYDFENDPAGEFSWHIAAQKFSRDYPLAFTLTKNPSIIDIAKVIDVICNHFRVLVENKGLWKSLYNQSGDLLHEHYAQRLFYAIADAYCKANNIDLTPEANGGSGPVDFKFSSGYHLRALVEVKYSSNPHLIKGYANQLPAYQRSQGSQYNVYLVIQTTKTYAIKKLRQIQGNEIRIGNKPPNIVEVDGREQKSASKK